MGLTYIDVVSQALKRKDSRLSTDISKNDMGLDAQDALRFRWNPIRRHVFSRLYGQGGFRFLLE